MLRVLAILPRNLAVVSTDELHRVTAGPGNKVVAELVDANTAAELVKAFEAFCPDGGAKAVPYCSLAPEEPQGPEVGNSCDYQPDVYAILPGCVIVATRGMYRVAIEPSGQPELEFQPYEDADDWRRKYEPSKYRQDHEGSKYEVYSYDELARSPRVVDMSPAIRAAIA